MADTVRWSTMPMIALVESEAVRWSTMPAAALVESEAVRWSTMAIVALIPASGTVATVEWSTMAIVALQEFQAGPAGGAPARFRHLSPH